MIQNVMQFMPIMIVFFAMQFPAGLALYWVVSNIFSIGQQWVIMRDKSLERPAIAPAAAPADTNGESDGKTQAPPAAPAATEKKRAETPRAPAKTSDEGVQVRPSGLLGGLSFGGMKRTAIPELTETTLQELGLDNADDQGNGAPKPAPNSGKSRSRKREKRKGGGKR